MNAEAKKLLVSGLALAEAPWLPIRRDWGKGPAICAARREASRRVVTTTGDAAERQRSQRLRDQLRQAGLWADRGPTPAGRRFARSWCWPLSRSTALTAARRIRERVAAGDCRTEEAELPWVPETLIVGCKYGMDESTEPLVWLQDLLLPLLAEGLLASASTTLGHTFYAVTEGATDEEIRAVLPANDRNYHSDLCGHYYDTRDNARAAILADTRRHQNLGELPVPLCLELESKRDPNDLANIRPLYKP